MSVKRLTEPAFPVSLDEVKMHLNLDFDDHEFDTLILSYISAARIQIEKITHRVVGESSWQLSLDAFPADGPIEIPKAPLLDVTSVIYDDASGNSQVVDPANYYVDDQYQPFGWIIPIAGIGWPTTIDAANSVRIQFVAGQPTGAVRDNLKVAILLLVGQWWETREAVTVGHIVQEMPNGFLDLIRSNVIPVLA